MKKSDDISIDNLKEIYSSMEELIVVTGKIMSGFDSHEKMSLAILLFFSNSKILDKVMKVRRVVDAQLESTLSEAEYEEWVENDKEYWLPPFDKTVKELLEMQDKNLIWNKHI